MRNTELAVEVCTNIAASRILALSLALATALVALCSHAFIAIDVGRLHHQWVEQKDAGVYAWAVRTESPAGLPVKDCDSLNAVQGVIAAGSIMSSHKAALEQAPDYKATFLVVTSGYIRAAWPHAPRPTPNIVVGSELAEEYGLSVGAVVSLAETQQPDSALIVSWAPERRSRVDGINASVLIVAPAAALSEECLVEATPGSYAAVAAVLDGWFAPELGAVAVPMTTRSPLVSDTNRALRQRASLWAGLAAGVVMLGLRLVDWWGRRADFALYRLLGMGSAQIAVVLLIETIVLTLAPAQLGVLLCLMWRADSYSIAEVMAVLVGDAQMCLVALAAPVAGMRLLSKASTLVTVKGQ